MKWLTAALLLAACGANEPYHCNAVVSGTGTAADGVYQCLVPVKGYFSYTTGAGAFQGSAATTDGRAFSFNVSFQGAPAPATYTERSLPTGGTYGIDLTSKDGGALWQAQSGSGSFTLDIRSLNTLSHTPLFDDWPVITGSLHATLDPASSNATTTKATVSMTF